MSNTSHNSLPEVRLERLYRALEPLHHQYDPMAKMLKAPFRAFGVLKIFQGFPVHPTRESLAYAAALLDTGDQILHQRAIKILQQILNLQDQQPNSKTYGVWPKYLEEKPFGILRPDKNWCDFLATRMLQVVLYHRDSLPPKIVAEIDRAILHAARAIQQRNVPLEYTNIAIMGIYVTLATAQIYKIPDLSDYAMTRLRSFHDYTFEQSSFSEYNSPTYTIIALEMLGRLRLHIENSEAQKLIDNIYRLAWDEIATHFHPFTKQWAGPHSRSYSTILESTVLALIERSTSELIEFGISETDSSIDEHWLLLPCPPDLEPFFLPVTESRTNIRTLAKNEPRQVLTTYLAPTFCLGTVNYSDLWHQRRSLLAYWGRSNKPSYLWLRCLQDGIDCAAAQFSSLQAEGSVLAGVAFATDINPINPYISGKYNSKIVTKDLRLRFEFGGSLAVTEFKRMPSPVIAPNLPVHLCVGDLNFQILIPYAQFGQMTPKWEIHQTDSCLCLDIVLWSGKQRAFLLSEIEQAAIAIALQISSENTSISKVDIEVSKYFLTMSWNQLSLKLITCPTDQRSLNTAIFT